MYTYPQFVKEEAARKRRRKLAVTFVVTLWAGICAYVILDSAYDALTGNMFLVAPPARGSR